jgi:hypothetical protein
MPPPAAWLGKFCWHQLKHWTVASGLELQGPDGKQAPLCAWLGWAVAAVPAARPSRPATTALMKSRRLRAEASERLKASKR